MMHKKSPYFIVTFLLFITLSCSSNQNKSEAKKIVFSQIANYPLISDSILFIKELRQIFNLEIGNNSSVKTKITCYQKVKIFGSEKSYFLIELDNKKGVQVSYPWKSQILLNAEGELIKILYASRFEFVNVFENENPFLLTLCSTSKGNGSHQLYKIKTDSLENAFEVSSNDDFRTYDTYEDNTINEPYELTFKTKDVNQDGFIDILFCGNRIFTQGQTNYGDWFDSETINGKEVKYSSVNPFKKVPVEYILLFDKKTKRFRKK